MENLSHRSANHVFWDVSSLFNAERHVQDKAAILAALRISPGGPTVVMTHHLPLRELIAPWRIIGGHEGERQTLEGDHGPIRFVTSQRGYPGEGPEFDPAFVLDISSHF